MKWEMKEGKEGEKEHTRVGHEAEGWMSKRRRTRKKAHIYPDGICFAQQIPVKRNRISLPLRGPSGMQMMDGSTQISRSDSRATHDHKLTHT